MGDRRSELVALITVVRSRWRAMTALRALTVASAVAAVAIGCAVAVHRLFEPEGVALLLLWATVVAAVLFCARSLVAAVRKPAKDGQLARFIEERCPEFEDSLATALGGSASADEAMAIAVVNDAVRTAREVDVDRVISRRVIRKSIIRSAAAVLALVVAVGMATGPARDAARHREAIDRCDGGAGHPDWRRRRVA